jgi:hypothetical protein
MYAVAYRRVLIVALLYLIGTRPIEAFGKETYKLNLKDYSTNKAIALRMW